MNKIIEQKIKDSMDIVEVVSQYTTLHKKGVNYVGLCPLHQDRSVGSFAVDPRRNICSCWACGKTGLDPIAFLQEKEHYTYEQALKWLAKLKHIDVEGNDIDIKIEPRKELPPLEMIVIPKSEAATAMTHAKNNTLVRWLRSLNWDKDQRARIGKVLTEFVVGEYITWKREAFTVFWQCDENLTLRSGKLMAYKDNGHRDKEAYPYFDDNNQLQYHNQDFVHSQMRGCPKHKDCKKCHKHENCPYPRDKYEYRATLFGMHLLNRYPGQTVNIVESEKTAIIMSIAYGTLWMATGGMQNLRRDILQPIINQKRDIILYPDRDGIESWKYRSKIIGYNHMAVNTEYLRKCWTEADGTKADIADVVVRLIQSQKAEQEIIDKYPKLKRFVEELDLEVCTK